MSLSVLFLSAIVLVPEPRHAAAPAECLPHAPVDYSVDRPPGAMLRAFSSGRWCTASGGRRPVGDSSLAGEHEPSQSTAGPETGRTVGGICQVPLVRERRDEVGARAGAISTAQFRDRFLAHRMRMYNRVKANRNPTPERRAGRQDRSADAFGQSITRLSRCCSMASSRTCSRRFP